MPDWRAELQELLNRCRMLGDEIPEPLFRLCELLVAKVSGPWDPHETPTNPGKNPMHPTPPPIPRVSPTPFRNVGRILDGKEPVESSSESSEKDPKHGK
jgi:hypothetical protein